MALYLIDRSGALSNARRTATGGYLVDAKLARTGVMEYVKGGRRIRHYNPPGVLEANLDQLQTVPVTNRHPAKMVDPETYAQVARGHVVGKPEFKDGMIHATLAIQDAGLIHDIEMGVSREVSMGYLADFDETPGVTEDGEAFDVSRISIAWNHIAILPAGRAGRSVSLVLDSAEIPNEDEDTVTIKIKGKEVTMDEAQYAGGGLEGELAAAQARVQQLTDELAAEKKAHAEAVSDEAINAIIEKRQAEEKAKQERAARLEKVQKAFPTIDLKDKSDAYIDGLEAALALDPDGLGKLKSLVKDKEEVEDAPAAPALSGKAKMLAANREQWGKGLAAE